MHILCVDQVLNGLEAGDGLGVAFGLGFIELLDLIKELKVLGVRLQGGPDHSLVDGLAQLASSLREEVSELGVEGGSLVDLGLGAEVGVEGVQGHQEHSEVGLHLQHVAHDLASGATLGFDEGVEVLEPCLLESGPHELQVLLGEDASDLRGLDARPGALVLLAVGSLEVLLEVGADRGVNEEDAVDVVEAVLGIEALGHDHLHAVEDSERVHFLLQLHRGLAVQQALDDHADIVDHLFSGHEVQEGGERLHGLSLDIAELIGQLLVALLGDRGDEEGRGLVLQEGAIVRLLQSRSHILEGVSGGETSVVLRAEEAAAEASHHGLGEAMVDVEDRELHRFSRGPVYEIKKVVWT
mmetsp:Transcript_44692/g.96085  ORF Transcript_44692/g.96085 Transcript_44692/m.96085 type:complete len:354 (-) Transcript_44692:8-1069(-)